MNGPTACSPPGMLSNSSVQNLLSSGVTVASSSRLKLVRASAGGFSGNGLRGPGLVAGQRVVHRDLAFFDAVDRLAGDAVQDVDIAALGQLPDGGNLLAFLRDVEEDRRRAEVVIPGVVMHHLEVPFQFAGERIDGDQRRAEQIRARAVAAPIVGGRLAEGHVEDAALGVDREEAPDVRAGAVLPVVALPGVVAGLAGARDGVERPEQFAGVDVPARACRRRRRCSGLPARARR